MVRVTSSKRNLLVGIAGVSIIVVLINIVLSANFKNLIGLIALLCFLVLVLIYNLNFIHLFLDGDKVVLKKFGKNIEYSKITRIRTLPIFSRQLGRISTIFLIRYLDVEQRPRFKFLDITGEKILLFNGIVKNINMQSAET